MKTKTLKHVGVLGMHWGQRKAESSGSSQPKWKKDRPLHMSKDADKAAKIKSKRLSEMSNDEIKSLATRLQLEKQYRDITAKQISPGKKFAGEVISSTSKTLLTGVILTTAAIAGKLVFAVAQKQAEKRGVKIDPAVLDVINGAKK